MVLVGEERRRRGIIDEARSCATRRNVEAADMGAGLVTPDADVKVEIFALSNPLIRIRDELVEGFDVIAGFGLDDTAFEFPTILTVAAGPVVPVMNWEKDGDGEVEKLCNGKAYHLSLLPHLSETVLLT
jgi:hypothetical protein